MTAHTSHFTPEYKSIEDIRLRKAQLLTDIVKDSNKIEGLWNELMHKPKDKSSPSKFFTGVITSGAGVLDGAILAWKLYRKFGGKKPNGMLGKKNSLFKKKK